MRKTISLAPLLVVVVAITTLPGCATFKVQDQRDPLQPVNRVIYKLNEMLDKAIIKPVTRLYKAVVPKPIDTGISHFFNNLDDVVVIVNDILQFKFSQALSDTGRLLVNSTIGIGGIFDVATRMDLPKHNEDFGQTFGYWGFAIGPYLVLQQIDLHGSSALDRLRLQA